MYQDENQLEKTEENGLVIADYLKLIKANWYWFIVSVFICFVAAAAYLMLTPNTYKRSAKILIKEDPKQGGATGADEMAILNEINFFNSRTNVNNEVEIIQSERIMQEVARRLNLEISYEINTRLGRVDIYKDLPVKVIFPDVEDAESFSFTLTLTSPKEAKIDDLVQYKEKLINEPIYVKILDTLDTPVGKMIIAPTTYNAENYINKPIYINKSSLRNTSGLLRERLKVDMSKDNTVITLSLMDHSVRRADDVLNTLLTVYNEDNIIYRNQVVVNTSRFINERLDIIEKELGAVDMNISEYKSTNFVADIQSSTERYLTESSNYNQQIFVLENQLSIAELIKQYFTNPVNNNSLIPSNLGIENASIEKQIIDYNNYMLRYNRLAETGSENSPAVAENANILAAMRKSIAHSIDNMIGVLKLQLKGLESREIQANLQISEIPAKEREITDILRRLKIQENLYLYLLQKREENELAGAITTSNFRIVDEAGGNSIPVSPKKFILMLIAFAIGLLIPCLIFWLRESLNTTVRSPKEITNKLTIPFIGTIPQLKEKNKDKKRKKDNYTIAVKENSRDALSESFRIVRTNMDFMNINSNKSQVVMITSFNVGSGKSFTSLNLAMSFVLTGKKVAIIDLDLRKATISKYIGSPANGVSGYLSNLNTNIDDIIVKGELNHNLDIIPVGALPPNPAELLLGENLQKLITELRNTYDYIFLDTTPIDILADAYIVGKVVDMTIFIIREGLLDRRMLPELENIYKIGKLKNMAVILNGVSNNFGRYGYNYSYGYGYGYGHKYGY